MAAGAAEMTKAVTAGVPFWATRSMQNEPLLFIQEEGRSNATARLLFTPSRGLQIASPDLKEIYVAGKDYVWKSGTNVVELTASSRIPFKTQAQMFPPPGAPNRFGDVLHHEGHFFHDLQVQASYKAASKWKGPVPVAELAKLKTTLAKLKSRQPVKIVALGDSITEGYNASAFKKVNVPPYQPAYPELVGNTLQEQFGGKVSVVNLGVGGTRAEWGLTQVDKITVGKPDLVILAFGMNHFEPAREFGLKMIKLLESVKNANPGADIVLVAPMCGNPRMFPEARFTGYRDELRKLEGPGVAVADVATIWIELMKMKKFADLSGNNVNHPNDFSHRVYAQVIVKLFGK